MAVLGDDAERVEGCGRAQDCADIVRVGDLVEHQQRPLVLRPVEQIGELPPEPPPGPDDGRTRHDHASSGEGRARVLVRYADPAWLVRLVLGLGGGARILEPVELAAEVARRASRALAQADAVHVAQTGAERG